MLEIERKAKSYLKSMDKLVMSCDNDEEVRMLACAMMTSAITILQNQIGPRASQKLINHIMEVRVNASINDGDER